MMRVGLSGKWQCSPGGLQHLLRVSMLPSRYVPRNAIVAF